MAGNVHDADVETPGEGQPGKPELDGDAPLLFLFQAVRVDARESLDERGFSMVHVARRAENDMLHDPRFKSEVSGLECCLSNMP